MKKDIGLDNLEQFFDADIATQIIQDDFIGHSQSTHVHFGEKTNFVQAEIVDEKWARDAYRDLWIHIFDLVAPDYFPVDVTFTREKLEYANSQRNWRVTCTYNLKKIE